MNKKIVGFVLAICLSIGLGSSVFAATYLGTAVGDGYAAQNNGNSSSNSSSASSGFWIPVGSKEDTLSGNVTFVAKYYAGCYIGGEQAGGKFIIADANHNQKAILSNSQEGWTVEYYQFSQEDLASMPKPASYSNDDAYVSAMEQWLNDRGFKDSQLCVAKTDEYGKVVTNPAGKMKLTKDFYKQIYDELSKGLNHTVSITSGSSSTGPEVSVSINGKEQYTFVSNNNELNGSSTEGIRVTSETDYFASGMQKGKKMYSLQATGKTENGKAEYKWLMSYQGSKYEKKVAADGSEYYDITDYTANGLRANASDAQIDSAFNAVVADYNNGSPKNKTDVSYSGGTITSYTVNRHSSNSTVSSQYNSETQDTSYFAGGNVTAVKNSSGTVTARREYTANGVLKATTGIETDTNGTQKVTTTVYDKWGVAYGTLNGDYSGDKYASAIQQINTIKQKIANGQISSIPKDSPVQNFSVTSKDLRNFTQSQLGNLKTYLKWTDTYINNLRKFDYGNGTVADVNMEYVKTMTLNGDVVTTGATKVSKSVGKVSKSMGTHKWHQSVGKENDAADAEGVKFTTTFYFGGATANTITCSVATKITQNYNDIIETDPAVEGQLWSSEPTDEELAAAMKERGIDENDEEEVNALKAELSQEKLEAKAKELGIDTSDEQAMEDLKNGFYTDSTGQTFAIVAANSINIMDGSGFQAAKGETVMIAVDKVTKGNIISGMSSTGDRSIMFMGDVRQSSTGYLTMTMNTNYGGGYEQGSEAVQTAKNNIFLTSLGAAIQNGMDMKKVSAELAVYNEANGTNFTTQDANDKLNNAAAEDAWIINNTNANMKIFSGEQKNYKSGWNELLEHQLAAIF